MVELEVAIVLGLLVAAGVLVLSEAAKRWAERRSEFETLQALPGMGWTYRAFSVVVGLVAGCVVAGSTWCFGPGVALGVSFYVLFGSFIVWTDLAARIVPLHSPASLAWAGLVFSPVGSLPDRVLAGGLVWGAFAFIEVGWRRWRLARGGEKGSGLDPGDVWLAAALGTWLGVTLGIAAALVASAFALVVVRFAGVREPRPGGTRLVPLAPFWLVTGWLALGWTVAEGVFATR